MKKPISPPNFPQLIESIAFSGHEKVIQLLEYRKPVDDKGRYLHWDKLRHLEPPDGITSEEWWYTIKLSRLSSNKLLPLKDINGNPPGVGTPDIVWRELHWLDRYTAGNIQSNDAITNTQTRNTYLIRSLVEEAINSSQIEGASTTRHEAKEMIRQDRSPKDKSEQMILNNYEAMRFIGEYKSEQLTPSIVFELQEILTKNTIDESEVGRFRTESDNVFVVDNSTNEHLHIPPKAEELPERLKALCDFANHESNSNAEETFIHPVIRAIALHFMLAYDHPFCDGNGRTARALFYWSMLKHGYWLMEFISISKIIKTAPVQYGKAFLYTETDDTDVTYFLIHQLDVIHKAVDALHEFLDKKIQGINKAEEMLVKNPRLKGKLNFRQLALLRHALKHPRFTYVIKEHQNSHGISHDAARRDLLEMSDQLKLLEKTTRGRKYYFIAPTDISDRIAGS